MSRPRRLLVGLVLLLASCQHTQSRAHLPAPLDLVPGVTTRRQVLEAWGAPQGVRDEPGGRAVLFFRSEVSDGWGVVVGQPLPMAWLLEVRNTHVKLRTAEFYFLPNDTLETARLRDGEGRLMVVK